MSKWKNGAAVCLGLVLVGSSAWIEAANAKPPQAKGRGNQSNASPTTLTVPTGVSLPVSVTLPTAASVPQTLILSNLQRLLVIDLIRGSNDAGQVLDLATRTQILNQVAALPPGIQKQLCRGKGLPPGIAKKVPLSKAVNTYLNLSPRYDLLVIGSNLVLLDPATKIVLDLVPNIL